MDCQKQNKYKYIFWCTGTNSQTRHWIHKYTHTHKCYGSKRNTLENLFENWSHLICIRNDFIDTVQMIVNVFITTRWIITNSEMYTFGQKCKQKKTPKNQNQKKKNKNGLAARKICSVKWPGNSILRVDGYETPTWKRHEMWNHLKYMKNSAAGNMIRTLQLLVLNRVFHPMRRIM